MEDCLKESMRKLAVWLTKTFKPIMTHDELEPIMATLGFIGLPPAVNGSGIAWKEYKYSARGCRSKSVSMAAEESPMPRLPFPRIDGLHIYTYRAFIDSVTYYLEKFDISDLFHIRGLPLHRNHDKNRKWRRMDQEGSLFVYREGTLDQTTLNSYSNDFNKNKFYFNSVSKKDNSDVADEDCNISRANVDADPAAICIVRLNDIISPC